MIIALLCLAAIIILLYIPVKAVIRLDNLRSSLIVSFLFIRIKRDYIVKKDKTDFFALYRSAHGKEKRIASLKSIIFKNQKEQVTDISLINLIKLAIQNRGKKRESLFYYLNKRSRIRADIAVELGAGDAYYTALLCGLAVSVGSALCAVYSTEKKNFKMSVKPLFNKRSFSVHADCIITITPANIIIGYIIYKIKARGKENASD